MSPRGGRGWPAAVVVLLVVAACSTDSTPEPTPVPTTFPVAGPDDATAIANAFVAAWAADDYEAMYATLDPGLHERYTLESFTDLYASFKRMTRTAGLTATIGTPSTIGLPAEPRRVAIPLPTPSPASTTDPSATVDPSATPTPSTPPVDPEQPLDGPVAAISVPLRDLRRIRPVRGDRPGTRHDARPGRGRVAGSLVARAAVPRARGRRRPPPRPRARSAWADRRRRRRRVGREPRRRRAGLSAGGARRPGRSAMSAK